MSRRVKHVSLMVTVQAGCLAVGLWMHHRYVVSSALQAVEESAWADLRDAARPLFSQLGAMPPVARRTNAGAAERLTRWLDEHRSDAGAVMIVDAQWRILLAHQDSGDSANAPMLGAHVDWAEHASGLGAGADSWGKLLLPDGPHFAVTHPLDKGQGYVIVHQTVAAYEPQAAALVEAVPTVGVVTFVWLAAILGIVAYMILARLCDQLEHERSQSARDAIRTTQNLVRTRDAVIFGLAKLAESRDPDTGDHLERISVYSTILASALRRDPRYCGVVTPSFVRLIGISSALHDIGKVGLADRILLKPGPLSADERASMQMHATIGGECLREIEQRLGGSNFLQLGREIAFGHHERWDGSGYPAGLAGTAISLSARIVAIADVYDALCTRRVYKEAYPHEECVAVIRAEAGKKLDPNLVEVWLTLESKFKSMALQNEARVPGDPVTESCETDDTVIGDEDLCPVPMGVSV